MKSKQFLSSIQLECWEVSSSSDCFFACLILVCTQMKTGKINKWKMEKSPGFLFWKSLCSIFQYQKMFYYLFISLDTFHSFAKGWIHRFISFYNWVSNVSLIVLLDNASGNWGIFYSQGNYISCFPHYYFYVASDFTYLCVSYQVIMPGLAAKSLLAFFKMNKGIMLFTSQHCYQGTTGAEFYVETLGLTILEKSPVFLSSSYIWMNPISKRWCWVKQSRVLFHLSAKGQLWGSWLQAS